MTGRQALLEATSTAVAELAATDLRVVSAYLYGSLVRSDFQPHNSDIDILLVVTDGVELTDLIELSAAVHHRVPEAEVTLLRLTEAKAGIHPGGSHHYFRNVIRLGVLLHGPDTLAQVAARPPSFDDAYRRLVQLCQRARIVIANPSKAERESGFWLNKYQHWVPICLMELLELHGTPEDRLHFAHAAFVRRFPSAARVIEYPYARLYDLQLFLEDLVSWIPRNSGAFMPTRDDIQGDAAESGILTPIRDASTAD